MRSKLFFVFIIFGTMLLHAQNELPSEPIKQAKTECSEAAQRADADFKKGIRKLYFFGIFDDYKYRMQLEKHGIQTESRGCLVTQELKCYSDKMYELIAQEKGFGFFEKVRLEVGGKSANTKSF